MSHMYNSGRRWRGVLNISKSFILFYFLNQGCEFYGSLLEDGSIQEVVSNYDMRSQSRTHRQPQLWVKSCWSHLGHSNKVISKKQAYRLVSHSGANLYYGDFLFTVILLIRNV